MKKDYKKKKKKSSGGFTENGAKREHAAFNVHKNPACVTERVEETVRAYQSEE